MSAPPRICKDCRWFRADRYEPTCGHVTSIRPSETDLVTGTTRAPRPMPCDIARWPPIAPADRCGPDGKYWEPAGAPGFV